MDRSPQTRPRLRFLLAWVVHLTVWCGVSALLFARFGRKAALLAALHTPAEPFRLGARFVAKGDADMAIVSILVIVCALAFVIGAVLKPRHWLIRRLAHLALGAYCFWSLCLLGLAL